MDMKALRNTLGRVPNAVCIVTTLAADGSPVGMTANSIIPVSASRPCLLWSLGRQSRSRAAFEAAGRFGITVLAQHQQGVARQLASQVADRFAGIAWQRGAHSGVPLITGSLARFECVNVTMREVGDHVTFIGEVVASEVASGLAPLLYVDGAYAGLEAAALSLKGLAA